MTRTTGRWWTPDGFVDGICEHDTHVRALEPAAQSGSGPMFLPAPVDLHVHGGGGHDCMGGDDAIRIMLHTHARHGAGAVLATSVTAPFDDIDAFIESATRVMRTPDAKAATLLGVHLEGPFISPDKLGAQPAYAAELDLARLQTWFDTEVVRVITFAPEVDTAGDLIALCERYRVRAQIGHTACSWQQAHRALQSGCGVTHLYNAMSGVAHRGGGAATAALAYADHAEIILDGFHVDQAAFDAARRAISGLYSVTDGTAASGMPDGDYRLGSLTVRKRDGQVLLPDGTLAGSCLTQRRVVAVLRGWEVDWHTIGALLAAIPAGWIGASSLGRIAPGASAQWLEIDGEEPVAIWLSGRRLVLDRE